MIHNANFTDIADLHKFVSVALHTAAGEGDYSSDLLSDLKLVASGFKALIYDLKEDSSFSTFQSRCKEVWETIEQARDSKDLSMVLVSVHWSFRIHVMLCSICL